MRLHNEPGEKHKRNALGHLLPTLRGRELGEMQMRKEIAHADSLAADTVRQRTRRDAVEEEITHADWLPTLRGRELGETQRRKETARTDWLPAV